MNAKFLEKLKVFGYGTELPERVRNVLVEYDKKESAKRGSEQIAEL